jgi:hypothetical protein
VCTPLFAAYLRLAKMPFGRNKDMILEPEDGI